MNPTAPVSLNDTRMAEIIALSQREFDDREAKIKTTMVSDPNGPEWPMKRGYKAARSHGRAAYEIEANADLGHVMASGQALPILKDGKATAQVGALTNYQDGRGLVRFSRSEKGQEAENLYASGNAQLSISTTRTRSGQDRPVALTLRASNGASKMDNEAQTIAQLGQKHGQSDLATKAIAAGQTLAEFRNDLLDVVGNDPLPDTPYVARETQGYSLGRAIRQQMQGRLDGLEAEVHQELSHTMPVTPRGVVVPNLVLNTRASMTTSNVAQLVNSMPMGSMFIDNLQPASAVMAAGATVLSGLSKAIVIPKETGDTTASFTAESSAVSESSLTISNLTLSPTRISATSSFTSEALIQSDPSIDNLIRNSHARKIAQAIDDGALEGNGTAPNPTGIVNTSGINTLTTAGSSTMTFAEALDVLGKLEEDNVPSGGAAFIMHPTDYATIAGTAVDAGSGRFVIENGQVAGRRVVQSTLATAGTVVCGDFSHLIVAMFGGSDLIVDPYSSATSAITKITSHNFADVGVRHAVAFCKVTLTA